MSPEINGNPPSVTKRKKNRDKKPPPPLPQAQSTPTSMNPLEFNMSTNCNYFPHNNRAAGTGLYHNQQNDVSIPDVTHYYSFLNYTNPSEPMSLPIYPIPNYYPNYHHHHSSTMNNVMGAPKLTLSTPNDGSSEYLSLPVGAPFEANGDSVKRRYSDPGLPNDSDDSSCSASVENKIVQRLTHQVHVLKESNRKLAREVMEMRIELNSLKLNGSRHHDRDYEPGMLADIIREVRDAARVREDALLARVKHMIEEKQLSMNHLQLMNDKNRSNDRISKLEEQLKSLSMNNINNGPRSEENSPGDRQLHEESNGTARQILELEREALELRRELQDTRARKEEADLKLMQLDKKLASIKRRNDISTSDEDGKTNSIDTISVATTPSSSLLVTQPPRVTLSGPVTDL